MSSSEADTRVVHVARQGILDARGHLDDLAPGAATEALLPFAAFAKTDAGTLSKAGVADLAGRLAPRGVPLVAKNVDTRAVFEWTREAGCTLFQGYYFCRPETRSGGALSAHHTHLRLLSALNQPRLTMDELEER